jgi:hypothetical protein
MTCDPGADAVQDPIAFRWMTPVWPVNGFGTVMKVIIVDVLMSVTWSNHGQRLSSS